jgi:hypothetical protein
LSSTDANGAIITGACNRITQRGVTWFKSRSISFASYPPRVGVVDRSGPDAKLYFGGRTPSSSLRRLQKSARRESGNSSASSFWEGRSGWRTFAPNVGEHITATEIPSNADYQHTQRHAYCSSARNAPLARKWNPQGRSFASNHQNLTCRIG